MLATMKAFAWAALAFLCVCGGLLALEGIQTLRAAQPVMESAAKATEGLQGTIQAADLTLKSVNATLESTRKATEEAGAVLENVNRGCGGGKPCGTLADVAKTLNTVRGTFGQIEIAANHEDKQLGTLDQQELDLFMDTHAVMGGAARTMQHFDELATDPAVPDTLHNVQGMTLHLDSMLTTADAAEQKYTYPYLHPSHNPFVRTWNGTKVWLPGAIKLGATLAP